MKVRLLHILIFWGLVATIAIESNLQAQVSPNHFFAGSIWFLDSPLGEQTNIIGQYPSGLFGKMVAQGDINGDGFEDIIASTTFPPSYKGQVYILPGPLSFGQTITMPQRTALILNGGVDNTYLGTYLDSGDLNGDGYDDIVVGTWSDGLSVPTGTTYIPAAATYVYLGSSQLGGTVSPANVVISDVAALTILHASGGSIVCNINGDAYDDLFLQDYFLRSRYEIRGILGSSRISMTAPLTIDLQSESSAIVIQGFELHTWGEPMFGNLGCGDVNGDGYDDLIVGAYGESPGGRYTAGRVYIIQGSSSITFNTSITVTVPSQAGAILEGVDGGVDGEEGDGLGTYLSVADVNYDGRADLILTAPMGDGPDNSFPEAGEVYLWLGRDLVGQTVNIGSEARWMLYGGNGERLGFPVHSADVDGDGYAEVILGCPHCNDTNTPPYYFGGWYVVDTREIQGTHSITEVAGLEIVYSNRAPYTGFLVRTMDLDADGYNDILLTAPSQGQWGDNYPGTIFVLRYQAHYQMFLPVILKYPIPHRLSLPVILKAS